VVSGPDLQGWDVVGRVGGGELEITGRLKLPVTELQAARDSGLHC
jgi:hypothetical protein